MEVEYDEEKEVSKDTQKWEVSETEIKKIGNSAVAYKFQYYKSGT